jgi:ABC-type branched-subunit amino acid transport system ATPase component
MSTKDQPILTCTSVTKRFGGLLALDRLNLEIRSCEILGIIGPNGSGKTTFFNVITGIFRATSGEIMYRGQDVTRWTPQQLHRAGIARTFQRSRLSLRLSIFDNVMIGNHTRLSHGIWFNLMNRADLKKEIDAYREKCRDLLKIFDPRLADRMDDLVGNQPMIDRRRIEVCRALISEPKLLLLDEPSAGMTEFETRQLMENILTVKNHFGNLAVALIEHEMSVIERISSRCVVLNFGAKVCEGSYAHVISDREVQDAYLGTELELA